MRHAVILAVLLAVSCASVDDRAACSTSSDCPSGQYCAQTADGNVCWADAAAPVVSSVAVSCSTTPCVRDGVLRVEAAAGDDKELAAVEAALDLDGNVRRVALARSGALWVADLPLRDWPFEAFSRPVVASVIAQDGARNESSGSATAIEVTRLRWERDLGTAASLTSPAIMNGGVAVLASTTGELHFVGPHGEFARDSVAATIAQIAAPPSVGTDAIWVGSVDGTLYPISLDGTHVGLGCATGERIAGTPSLLADGTRAVVGSQGSLLVIGTVDGGCNFTTTEAPVLASAVVMATGEVLSLSTSVIESFTPTTTGALRPNWNRPYPGVGDAVVSPPATDKENGIWTVALNGAVHLTQLDGTTERLATVGSNASGITILSDGTAVLGDQSTKLRRVSAHAEVAWQESAPLNGVPNTPMIVVSGSSTQLIVPTSTGRLFAVRESDGSVAWSAKLSAGGAALQPANIYTPPGQPAGAVMSTAYVSGADGKLYAVVVDGQLDTSAPWPKAFHDPRNTNNAGTRP